MHYITALVNIAFMTLATLYCIFMSMFFSWVSSSDWASVSTSLRNTAFLNGGEQFLQRVMSPAELAQAHDFAATAAGPHSNDQRMSGDARPLAAVVVTSSYLDASMSSVSAMYRERILAGLRAGLLLGAPWVVLTGTSFECRAARDYLSSAAAAADAARLFDSPEAAELVGDDGDSPHFRRVAEAVHAHVAATQDRWLTAGAPLRYFSFPFQDAAMGQASYNTSVGELVANMVAGGRARFELAREPDRAELMQVPKAVHSNATTLVIPGVVFATVADKKGGEAAEMHHAAETVLALLAKTTALRQRTEEAGARRWWWMNETVRVLAIANKGSEQCTRLLLKSAADKERTRFLHAVRTELLPAATSFLRSTYTHAVGSPGDGKGEAAVTPSSFRVRVQVLSWPAPSNATTHELGQLRSGWLDFEDVLPENTPANRLWLTRKLGAVAHYLYLNYRRVTNAFTITIMVGEPCTVTDVLGYLSSGEIKLRDILYQT